jgi:hypothetical protein
MSKAVFTDSRFTPASTFLEDILEAFALLTFVAGKGCSALAYLGA